MTNSGKILASVGNKRNMLVFQLSEYKGTRTFDIRKHFFSKDAGDYVPTKKGIALAENSFTIVKNILGEFDEEITEWLERFDEVPEAVRKDLENQRNASSTARFEAQQHRRSYHGWKSPTFFERSAQGGRDELTYNEQHALVGALRRVVNDAARSDAQGDPVACVESLHLLLDAVLLSFDRARSLFGEAPVINPEILFETLMFNWGRMLSSYVEDMESDGK